MWPVVLGMLLCLCGHVVRAQNDRMLADSLIRLLPMLGGDSIKVFTYRDIAYYLQETSPDSALHYARKGEKLARSLGLVSGQIWNLNQQGLSWEHMDMLDSSIRCYQQALDLATEAGAELMAAQMINSMGAAYYFKGDMLNALATYDEALDRFERIGDDRNAAWTLNNIGIIHRVRRDHQKAIRTYERSLELKQRMADTLGIARTYHNLGLAYSYLGDHDRSLFYFEEERRILEVLGDTQELARTQVGLGMALHMLGRTDEAKHLLENALADLSARDPVEKATTLLHLGLIDLEQGNRGRGMERLHGSYALLEHSGRLDLLRSVNKELAMACGRIGDHACAGIHWKNYAMLSDSMASEQRQWAIEEMQAKYETREKENTILLQELELAEERAQRDLYLIIGILAVLLLVAAVAYGWSSLRHNNKLLQANSRIQAALAERELLLKEMHHRVKNNLQMLNSLLSIQSRSLEDPNAREAMLQNRERVQAIGLIHQFLYTRDRFHSIDMQAYMKRLLEHFSHACELEQQEIQLISACEAMELDVDVATPIGLVVNELLTNAIKHAFGTRGGRIVVTLRHHEEGLLLEVQDDGRSIAARTMGTGFGHVLLDTLSRRLGARTTISNTNGTRHTMIIPSEQYETVENTGGRG